MIADGKKWHYLAVKSLSALLTGITSRHDGDFYCLNCFHCYITKNKLKKHEKACNDHDYCCVELPNEYNKILKHKRSEKLIKAPFIINAGLECLPEKMHSCHNNPENTSTTKINIRKALGYLMFTNCSFDATKNTFDCYRGKDWMEKFCKNLKEHATKIIMRKKKWYL